MTTVAVAVNSGGDGRGNASKRAVKWAVDNLLPQFHQLVLVHVVPTMTNIATTSGDRTPAKELDANIVAKRMEDVREKAQETFAQYKRLKSTELTELEFETALLEHDNVAEALVDYIRQSGIKSFVMGSESATNHFWRKMKGLGIPQTVLRYAPDNCDIFVVSKHRVKSKLASSLISGVANLTDKQMPFRPTDSKLPIVLTTGHSPINSPSYVATSTGPLSWSEVSRSYSLRDPSEFSLVDDKSSLRDVNRHSSVTSTNTQVASSRRLSTTESHVSYEQFDLGNDIEQLRQQLHIIQDLIHAQEKVQILSSECVKEGENRNSTGQEETLRSVVEQQILKHLQALKDEPAKSLLVKQSCERRKGELNALKEAKERQKIVDALMSSEGGTKRYTLDEINAATDFFSENKVIGEGSYGKVYKGDLEHTPVAIKILHPDATHKNKEFLTEVKILSQLRHPNIVSLNGACPKMGCLVYEYMENGSLEEYIFRHNGREPLPWFARFHIAFEIACGLAYLHNRKPEPIIHRALKPGNILLGKDYVTKISDVGLAKLLSDNVPDSITMFGNSLLAGTLYYIDPEYQRTGTIRPKSDLYSFGIILLQLLTARHPNGLLLIMENAIDSGSLSYMLDDSIKDWPLAETEELAKLALECCELRSRDRPDLDTGVLPVLKKLADVADARMKIEKNSIFAPRRYFCPILHEIMDDPHVAADGFTYERKAIELWFERHDVSPVTKHKLEHFNLCPNTTLLTDIQEWRSHLASKRS